jgi:hypothetical protein
MITLSVLILILTGDEETDTVTKLSNLTKARHWENGGAVIQARQIRLESILSLSLICYTASQTVARIY